jgi:hypothetical protein
MPDPIPAELVPWPCISAGDVVLREGRLVEVAATEPRTGMRGFRYISVKYTDSPSVWDYDATALVALRRSTGKDSTDGT